MLLNTFRQAAPALYRAGTALELISGPGVGKSSVMRQVAADLSRILQAPVGLVTQILSGMDPADVRGFLFPVKDETNSKALNARFSQPVVFPAKWNVEVFVNGEIDPDYDGIPDHGILFLDEFGQADHEVQKPMGQLMLDKRIGEYKLPEGWVVWAASNRMSDKSGVVKRLMFLQNRCKQISIEPMYEPWEAWANKAGLHPLAITFAKTYPSKVFQHSVPQDPGPFCTPRSLVLCTQDLMAMRTEEHGETRLPDDGVALEVINGWLGESAGIDFIGHIRLANDLPSLEAVAAKPKETKVPERADARFVMANMLAHHTKKANAKAFITYVQRLDKEMQVLFVQSVAQRSPMVLTVAEFSQWTSQNQDLLLAAHQA